MLIAELGLEPATKRALQAAGIKNTDQLRPANELLATESITGAVLCNIVSRLHAHDLGLRANPRLRRPTENDIEMLRLRVVEGFALRDIATIFDISPERVRQRLHVRFGLSGEPPAALERRLRGRRRPDWERIVALRLCRAENGLPMAVLLRGLADGLLGIEARAAVGRMKARGLVTVKGTRVIATAALRDAANGLSPSIGTRRGTVRRGRGG
jgi:hypothetical protein